MLHYITPRLKVIKTLLILVILSSNSFAQFTETISSGRPGQAISGATVGQSIAQIQTGLNQVFFSANNSNFSSNTNRISSTVLRIGILENLELSGVFDYSSISDETGRRLISGVSNTEFGARINLIENMGWISSLGVQGRLLLKAQGSSYQRQNVGSILTLATGHQINDQLTISTNWSIVNSGFTIIEDDGAEFLYVLNAAYSLNDRFGCFVEVFGELENGSSFFDGGLAYLANDDLQLDVSAGWLGQDGYSAWFADLGISWRFSWRSDPIEN